jgi:hypothetical protein
MTEEDLCEVAAAERRIAERMARLGREIARLEGKDIPLPTGPARSPGFARWKRRAYKPIRGPAKVSLRAVLVRSERRGGKPRQKVVAHLGSIDERDIPAAHPRERFWRDVDSKLADLPPQARAKAEATLQAVVPRPTREELQAADRERNARPRWK